MPKRKQRVSLIIGKKLRISGTPKIKSRDRMSLQVSEKDYRCIERTLKEKCYRGNAVEPRPTKSEFLKRVKAFNKHEKRNPMYKVAIELVSNSWGKWDKVTDGLGVLLLTWNNALYRYGIFDFNKLETSLRRWRQELNQFRGRTIKSLNEKDEKTINAIFENLLRALISEGKNGKLRKSPVAVAKALHLLAPDFFPLWDNEIAIGYKCHWIGSEKASEKYIQFCWASKRFVEYLRQLHIPKDPDKSWLKLIDEYAYAKFTYDWI